MPVKSPLLDVEIPKLSFADFIFETLKKHDGNAVAVIDSCDSKKFLTFKQVVENSRKCACAFRSLGVRKGDVIATCFANCIEFPVIVIAAAACGAIITTCNPLYTEDEIQRQFEHSQPKVVFVDPGRYQHMKDITRSIESVQHIFSAEESSQNESLHDLLCRANPKDYPYDVLIEPSEDIMVLPYSSGTTGLPKGVMLTHQNVVAISTVCRASFPVSYSDAIYLVVPMFHIYGIGLPMLSLAQGAKLVVEKRFSLESFFSAVEKHKITFLSAVPPMLLAIFNSPMLSKYDISSLTRIMCGAAPMPSDVARKVKKRLDVNLFQAYGMTECGVITTAALNVDIPVESVGVVAPNTMCKIVDLDTGKELAPNENGEVCMKSLQRMRGYYKNPTATAGCVEPDGWFHTGDIGYYDEHGCLYIVDRLKELIKYKGFQVAPAELEETLLLHPKISDAAVVGISDKQAGEVPKAFLVRNDLSLTEAEVHRFMAEKLSPYKALRGGISFVDVIPKSASGKILRKDLRAMEEKSRL